MRIDFERLDNLLRETGKKKKHLCGLVGRGEYYIRDAKNKGVDIPADYVSVWADELNTTPEYLMGNTDIKEKPTAEAMSFEDIKRAVKSMSREQLIELAIAIAQEQGER